MGGGQISVRLWPKRFNDLLPYWAPQLSVAVATLTNWARITGGRIC